MKRPYHIALVAVCVAFAGCSQHPVVTDLIAGRWNAPNSSVPFGFTVKGTLRNDHSNADLPCNEHAFTLIGNGKTYPAIDVKCDSDRVAKGTFETFTASFDNVTLDRKVGDMDLSNYQFRYTKPDGSFETHLIDLNPNHSLL